MIKILTALAILPLLSNSALASYIPDDSSSWTTLTPSTTLSDIQTDYTTSFGIAIVPISSSESDSASFTGVAKRDYVSSIVQPVSQINDGQIQGPVSQTSLTTIKQTSAPSVSIISGPTQTVSVTKLSTIKPECDVCTTEHTVFTLSETDSSAPSSTSANSASSNEECAQFTTFTTTVLGSTYVVESSLGGCDDDQTFATSSTFSSSESSKIDSNEEATTITSTTSAFPSSHALSTFATITTSSDTDSSISTSSSSASSTGISNIGATSSCKKNGTLTLTLEDSILKDSSNRIGSIVANRQFQFDGPTPQAGAVIAAGWGITNSGRLALGNSSVFYQCLSGTFYNLYDQNIGSQCAPVYLYVVNLIDC